MTESAWSLQNKSDKEFEAYWKKYHELRYYHSEIPAWRVKALCLDMWREATHREFMRQGKERLDEVRKRRVQ